jgi:hypothetical protein
LWGGANNVSVVSIEVGFIWESSGQGLLIWYSINRIKGFNL